MEQTQRSQQKTDDRLVPIYNGKLFMFLPLSTFIKDIPGQFTGGIHSGNTAPRLTFYSLASFLIECFQPLCRLLDIKALFCKFAPTHAKDRSADTF